MLAAIRSFRFVRSLGSIVIYYGGNALLDRIDGMAQFLRSLPAGVIIYIALAVVLPFFLYFGILAFCALWYFTGAKAGPWQGALLGVILGVGIALMNIAENMVRRQFGLPVEILHLNIAGILWIPVILLFALFGWTYARILRAGPM
jgi:hypothetical protein